MKLKFIAVSMNAPLLFLRFVLAAILGCSALTVVKAGTITLQFEQNVPLTGTQVGISSYSEDGFFIKPFGPEDTIPPFRLRHNAGDVAGFPDDGSAFLQLALGDSFELVNAGANPFDAISIDLAEYSTGTPGSIGISFTGFLSGGGSTSHTFMTDGIMDGQSGVSDFETFLFPVAFSNLIRLESSTNSFSLDNLVLNAIPEPSSALLLFGGILLTVLRFRKR
jgi:hypothetical protein